MSFDDFNGIQPLCDTFSGFYPEESDYARRTDYFCPSDGLVAAVRIRQVREAVSRNWAGPH
jgi:hypothetical protein